MAFCFLENACLDKKYWTYALNMAFYVKNMLLHTALEKTPYEMMYNEKHDLSFVKLFGCVAFMHIEKPFHKKSDQTSQKGTVLGNSDNSKCYLVGFEDKKGELKIRKSRNVRFNENEFYFKHKKTQKFVEHIDNDSNEVFFE